MNGRPKQTSRVNPAEDKKTPNDDRLRGAGFTRLVCLRRPFTAGRPPRRPIHARPLTRTPAPRLQRARPPSPSVVTEECPSMKRLPLFVLILALLLPLAGRADDKDKDQQKTWDATVEKAVKYFRKTQDKDGSWGAK